MDCQRALIRHGKVLGRKGPVQKSGGYEIGGAKKVCDETVAQKSHEPLF